VAVEEFLRYKGIRVPVGAALIGLSTNDEKT